METRTAPPLIGGRYRIDGLLGEGGMGRVFDAFDERLGRPVAVKILRPETRALPGMRERFQQEALIAARLIHPNIVAVLDFGEDRSSSYLVMERLPGSTLRDEIIARAPLSQQRVTLVTSETLGALAAAHEFGVLHRDIKPSNILLHVDGHTKITHFGIAKSFDVRREPDRVSDDVTMTGIVLGTPGYLAPERQYGRPATVQSDLYSVGAVMVEAITGRRFDPGNVPTEGLPPPFRDVACRALAPSPRDRFTSASEMLQTLRASSTVAAPMTRPARVQTAAAAVTAPMGPPVAPGTALLTPPRVARPRPRRGRARRRGLIAVAAVLTLLVTLFLLLENFSQPTGPATSAAKLLEVHPPTRTDPVGSAIKALAAALADGGLRGDGALADALDTTAAQSPGASREAAAEQALSLAQVLLDGGGITSGQYQDAVHVLQPTGATVPTTAQTVPTTAQTAVSPSPLAPFFQDHGRDHGPGNGNGNGVGGQG